MWESNVKQFTDVSGSLWVTLWALSGSVNYQLISIIYEEDYTLPKVGALFLWALYCVIAVLIFLNVLIGLMYKSMDSLRGRVNIDYKCTRAQMLTPYISGGINPFPPPFNIIPRVYHVICVVNFIKLRIMKKKRPKEGSKLGLSDIRTMLLNVKTRWRREQTMKLHRGRATTHHVRELDRETAHNISLLLANTEQFEHYLESAYQRK